MKKRIIKALGVACALTGTEMTDEQAEAMARQLDDYPEELVIAALKKASREVKFRLTLADVIERIDDGHPSPEIAWAMVPKGEGTSAAVTAPMMQAYAAVVDMLESDATGARIHFCRVYAELVERARDEGRPCEWFASLGVGDTEAERFEAKAEAQRRNARIHGAGAYPALERPAHVDAPPLPRGGDAVAGALAHVMSEAERRHGKAQVQQLRKALRA